MDVRTIILVLAVSLITPAMVACAQAVEPEYLATLTDSVDHACGCGAVWKEAATTTGPDGVRSMTREERNRIAAKGWKCLDQTPEPLKIPTPDGSVSYRYVESLVEEDRGKVEALQERYEVCRQQAIGAR